MPNPIHSILAKSTTFQRDDLGFVVTDGQTFSLPGGIICMVRSDKYIKKKQLPVLTGNCKKNWVQDEG